MLVAEIKLGPIWNQPGPRSSLRGGWRLRRRNRRSHCFPVDHHQRYDWSVSHDTALLESWLGAYGLKLASVLLSLDREGRYQNRVLSGPCHMAGNMYLSELNRHALRKLSKLLTAVYPPKSQQ